MQTLWPKYPSPGYISSRKLYTCSPRDMYKNIHHNTIKNKPKVETEMLITSRMDKPWNTEIVKYYEAMKRNKLQLYATIQMNLRNKILGKRSQIQERIICMIPFI